MASHPGAANRLRIFPGDGLGGFGAAFDVAIGNPRSLQVADFNADGLDDVLVSRPRSNVMDFRLQNLSPPGSFTAVPVFAGAGGGPDANGTWTQDTADFDGDGDTDAVVADASAATVSRMRNANGLGTAWQSNIFPTLSVARAVAAGDFDADGFADIASGNLVAGGGVSVLAGDGTGLFAAPVNIDTGTGQVTQLRAADLNGDGRMDLVLAVASQNRVTVLIGNTGQFGPLASPPSEFSTLVRNPDNSFTRSLKNGTTIEYDASGLMTARVDRNGNATVYGYDAFANLTTITDPVGLVTTLAYTGGLLTGVTGPAGRVTSFAHDGAGDLVSITDPDLSQRLFAYDAQHRLTSQTSKRGFASTYLYGFHGRNTRADRPDTSFVLVAPSEIVGLIDAGAGLGTPTNPAPFVRPEDVVATFTDGNGNTTTFEMDRFGGATEIIEPIEGSTTRTTSRACDADGLVTCITLAVRTADASTEVDPENRTAVLGGIRLI